MNFITNIKKIVKDFYWTPKQDYNFSMPQVIDTNENYMPDKNLNMNTNISPNLSNNLEYIKTRFNTLINSDIVIRNFIISTEYKQYKAFLLFIDGMVDSNLINDFILNPLMLKNNPTFQHDFSGP